MVAAHVVTTKKELFFHPARNPEEIKTIGKAALEKLFPYLETLTTVIEPYYPYLSPLYEQTLNNMLSAVTVKSYYVRVGNALLDVSYGTGEFVAGIYAHLIDVNDNGATYEESLLRKTLLLHALSSIAYNGLVALSNDEHPEIGETIAKVSKSMLAIVTTIDLSPSFGVALESPSPLMAALYSKEITEALEKGVTDYTRAMIKTHLPYLEEKLALLEEAVSTFYTFMNETPEKITLKA